MASQDPQNSSTPKEMANNFQNEDGRGCDQPAFRQPSNDAKPAAQQTQLKSRIEPELLEIFSAETQQHVSTLEHLLMESEPQGVDLPISAELTRALHTLNGSARTAEVAEIAELCEPLERYVKVKCHTHQALPVEVLPLFKQVTHTIKQVLESLQDFNLPMPNSATVRQQIVNLLEQELTAQGSEQALNRNTTSAEMSPDTSVASIEVLLDDHGDVVLKDQPDKFGTSPPDIPDEQDRELVEIFLEEATDLLDDIDNSLQAWGSGPPDIDAVKGLQRHLHTLKGGARMAGYTSIGDLSHSLESLILEVVESRLALNPDVVEVLHQSLDRLHGMHKAAENAQPVYPALDLIEVLDQLKTCDATPVTDEAVLPSEAMRQDSRFASPLTPDGSGPNDPAQIESARVTPQRTRLAEKARIRADVEPARDATALGGGASQELIRVRSELLDNLVNNAGEVNIYHARLGQQISAFGYNLSELEQTVVRLRNQLRNLEIETEAQILFRYEQEKQDHETEFDPLELDRYSTIQQLSRALSESVNDLVSIQGILVDLVRDSETLLLQQSRVSTDLQEGLMYSRMVKFASLAPRLRRIARQTARELDKKVNLHLIGETNELDRSVLDRMVAPLEHMLRNAISHGIDTPEKRAASGKSEVGNIRVNVAREGSEVVIRVEDDGAGIDLEAVRNTARRQGLLGSQEKLSDHDIMQFILESGFSTAQEVTQISGRGVGMDVVNSEIKQLGGVLSIDSIQGKGTVFTIRLPFTLAINQALLVQSGEDLYAVPLASIEGIVRLTADELKTKYTEPNPTYEYAANNYKLKHLGALLGMSQPLLNDPHSMVPILLVRSGDQRVALQTESLVGSREVVVKPVGPQISKVRGISGATILGDGRVVLILDVAGMIRMGASAQLVSPAKQLEAQTAGDKLTTVMVVDDSITIRKVTSRMLERNNYTVLTAKDGVDALSQLQEQLPDLFLLDIEMPRMDGYELATHIRNNDRLTKIPIIMITSRTGEKHRQRAMGIGVNKYLGKPYQESDLLENIREMLVQG